MSDGMSNDAEPDGRWGADLERLRARAEELVWRRAPELGESARRAGSHSSTPQLAHDLAVHRIEVDLQRDELLRTMDELDESAMQYARLYDFAPSGIMSIDAHGAIVRTNLAAAQLLGTERAHLVGRRVVDFIAADDRGVFSRYLRSARSDSSPHVCEVELAVGSSRPVSAALDIRRSGSGGGWEIAFVDMSQVRAAEREIGELGRLAEREAMGRRLHDTVLQRLFGLTSSLEALLLGDGLDATARSVVERLVEEMHLIVQEIWETVLRQPEGEAW